MKAIIFNRYGDPDVLEYADVATPMAGPGELLIKVKAASVNPVDWKIRKGRLKIITGKKFPLTPGIEVSGIIDSVGKGVSNFSIGQKVFAATGYKSGGYAEYFTVLARKAVILPDNFSFEEGCTLAVTGVTALQALRDHGNLEEGMHVLINGASGGFGCYAVQIAKILGAKVTGVCSAKNIELVKSLGADEVIDYNINDFSKNINKYDIIIDAAANNTFKSIKRSLKNHGVFIKLNFSVRNFLDDFSTRFFSSKKAKLILLKDKPEDIKWVRDHIAIGKLKVIIDRKFPLSEAAKAHEYSETGRSKGKIVLMVD